MRQISSIKYLSLFISGLALVLVTTACFGSNTEALSIQDKVSDNNAGPGDGSGNGNGSFTRPAGWSEESHGSDTDPNYDVVFPDDQVNQITITITPEDWAAMQANMVELFGEPGTGSGPGSPGGGFEQDPGQFPQPGEEGFPEGFEPPEGGFPPADQDGFLEDFEPQLARQRPPRDEGFAPGDRAAAREFGPGNMTPENPDWVPATIEFQGDTWTQVGIRYKGNSSLTSGWNSGEMKMPFKLDFDEFEDEYPEIENQRFYGFKQLSLANGFSDSSFLRDAAASELLQQAGLPAAETAFYEVVLDYGEGPVSLGLYTVIEVVDDTVVDKYFGSDSGNIYQAEGPAATFAASTYDQIAGSFQKENNEDEADWSDIEALFDTLHSTDRANNPAVWRANLEALFDVDAFLEWLAVSAVIEHWDAYGNMSHNYYLYNDPDTGQLTWISWDHNMVMIDRAGDGRADGRMPFGSTVSLDKAEVDDNWPLIRYLLDDPIYYEQYQDYLAETIEGPFDADHMAEWYQEITELIVSYAVVEVGEEVFDASIQMLIEYAYQRADLVEKFLTSVGQGALNGQK